MYSVAWEHKRHEDVSDQVRCTHACDTNVSPGRMQAVSSARMQPDALENTINKLCLAAAGCGEQNIPKPDLTPNDLPMYRIPSFLLRMW
jgi:hypothetical protein